MNVEHPPPWASCSPFAWVASRSDIARIRAAGEARREAAERAESEHSGEWGGDLLIDKR